LNARFGRDHQPSGVHLTGDELPPSSPVVYIYLDRLQDLLRQWRGSVQPAKAVA